MSWLEEHEDQAEGHLSEPALLSTPSTKAEDRYSPEPSTATIIAWLTSSGQVSIKIFRSELWELKTVSAQ